jgi:hypothetical protein
VAVEEDIHLVQVVAAGISAVAGNLREAPLQAAGCPEVVAYPLAAGREAEVRSYSRLGSLTSVERSYSLGVWQ